MKILHVLDHYLPLFSGYTFRSSYILKNQKAVLGLEPLVVTSMKQGPTESPVDNMEDMRIYRTPASLSPRLAGQVPVLREWLQMKALEKRILEVAAIEKPQVLHAHSPVLNAWPAIWAGKRLGIPVVYEIRAFWEDAAVSHGSTREGSLRYRATRAFETGACNRAAAVVTICEGLRRGLLARGIAPEKLFVLANGVDAQNFLPPAPAVALRKKLGLEGKRVLGFVGSLYRYEGLSYLLKAIALLATRRTDVHCLIVGGGYDNEEEELRNEARQLGIADKVIIQGKVPHRDVNDFYSLIDILVYPRVKSRLLDLVTPLKPLEAMAMEKAVMGSDVGGIKELIEDGKNGILFKADDAVSLADHALALLEDPVRIVQLGKTARLHVERERSWSKLIEVHASVYRSVGAMSP